MVNWSPDIYEKTIYYAGSFHKGQTYGGRKAGETVEYMNHISCVAMETIQALNHTSDVNGDLAVQCALLHDVIEDTPATYEMIVANFGAEVANGVLALTKNETLATKREQMLDSLERICSQTKEIWMVKMADRITNLYHPAHYWKSDKILAYYEESLVIHEKLHTANQYLSSRLEKKISEYKQKFL